MIRKPLLFLFLLSSSIISLAMQPQDNKQKQLTQPVIQAIKDGKIEALLKALSADTDIEAVDDNGWTLLHHAAFYKQLEIVTFLLNKKPELLTAKSKGGLTPLHSAARGGSLAVVHELIIRGADIDAHDSNAWTVLHFAATNKGLEVVRFFLKHKPEFISARTKDGVTPLHRAAAYSNSIAVINELLIKGANIDEVDNNGWTALHFAAFNGQLKATVFLLEKKPELINIKGGDGMTPLHAAACSGSIEVLKELLEKAADIDAIDNKGFIALHYAAHENRLEAVKFLLSKKPEFIKARAKDGYVSPLHSAIDGGSIAVIKELLVRGADIDTVDNNGRTTVHYAINKKQLEVIQLLLDKKPELLKSKTKQGHTPLHTAAHRGSVEITKELLTRGADSKAVDNNGWTALHWAASNGQVDVVKLLIEVDPHAVDIKNNTGHTPLQCATEKVKKIFEPHSVSSFFPAIKAEALPVVLASREEIKDEEGCPLCLELYNDIDDKKVTILPCAHKFHAECTNPWIKNGRGCPLCAHVPEDIDANALDKKLFVAVMKGDVKEIEQALHQGADSNSEYNGMTPLMFAAFQGKPEIVRLLLKYSAINPIKNIDDCLHNAAEEKYYEVMLALIEEGAIVDVKNKMLVDRLGEAFRNEPPLFFVVITRDFRATRLLIQGEFNLGILKKALLYAISQGHIEIVACLIEVLQKKEREFLIHAPLEHARMLGQRTRVEEYKYRYEKIVQMLLEAGKGLIKPPVATQAQFGLGRGS